MVTSAAQQDAPSLVVPAGHCKDPFPRWSTHAELSRQCRDIVTSLGTLEVLATPTSLPTFAHPIHWQPPKEGITLVELFAGTGLATGLEAGLKVRRYIHVESRFVSNCAA